MKNYNDFLKDKEIVDKSSGFKISTNKLNNNLFDWQKVLVKWAIARGRSAIFAECGLGKTIIQLSWANQINIKEKKPILILAPLAVSEQTVGEGKKFDIKVNKISSTKDIKNGINICNYEKLHKLNITKFCGVVLDESSILKNFSGSIRNQIIECFVSIKYKLACSATPAPNDYMELGNHSEFLGVMTRSEMLSMFFINDTANTGTWRLKGHVEKNIFWKWLSSWAVMLSKPSDLGFADDNFILPKINYHEIIIPSKVKPKGCFFLDSANTLNERRQIRKDTIDIRCKKASELANDNNEKWLFWCNLNDEGKLLNKYVNDSLEVAGRHKDEIKTKRMLDFTNGKISRLVTKPKIAGLGMNWQICNNAVFVGLSDSWEQFYQAVRRIWRFGQKKEVDVYIIIEEREGSVLKNIKRKDKQAKLMIKNMISHTKELTKKELTKMKKTRTEYAPEIKMEIPKWME